MNNQYKEELNKLNNEIKEKVIDIIGNNLEFLSFEFLDDYKDYIEMDNEYKKYDFIKTYLKDIQFNSIESFNLEIDIILRTDNFYVYSDKSEEEKKEQILKEVNDLLKIEMSKISFYSRPIKITVSDEYDNTSMTIDNFIYEVTKNKIEETKGKLKQSNNKNVFNSEEAILKFGELAQSQRNLPEEAMLKAQKVLCGGVLSSQIEHIGDLTHRTSERVYTLSDYAGSLENICWKINRGLNSLKSGYGFKKEHEENIESNYDYNKNQELNEEEEINFFAKKYPTIEDYKKNIDKVLLDYALEHDKLEVYNHFQYAAKMSAIALGLQRFDIAINYLEYLKKIADDPVLYIDVAGSYDEKYLSNKKYLKLEELVQNDKAFELEKMLEKVKIKKNIEIKEEEYLIKKLEREFTQGYCAEFAIAAQQVFGFDIGVYQAIYIEDKEEYKEELELGIEAGSSESMATNSESCHAFLIIEDKIFDIKGLRDLNEEEMYFSNSNILSKRIFNVKNDIELLESFMGSSEKSKIEIAIEYLNKNKLKYLDDLEDNQLKKINGLKLEKNNDRIKSNKP